MATKNDELTLQLESIVEALNRIDGTLQLMIDLFLETRKRYEEERGYSYDD